MLERALTPGRRPLTRDCWRTPAPVAAGVWPSLAARTLVRAKASTDSRSVRASTALSGGVSAIQWSATFTTSLTGSRSLRAIERQSRAPTSCKPATSRSLLRDVIRRRRRFFRHRRLRPPRRNVLQNRRRDLSSSTSSRAVVIQRAVWTTTTLWPPRPAPRRSCSRITCPPLRSPPRAASRRLQPQSPQEEAPRPSLFPFSSSSSVSATAATSAMRGSNRRHAPPRNWWARCSSRA